MSLGKFRKKAFIVYMEKDNGKNVNKEADFVLKIRQALLANAIDVFPYTDTPKFGPISKLQWQGLQEADVVIAVLSEEFPEHQEAHHQLYIARTLEKRIIPVMIEHCWKDLQHAPFEMSFIEDINIISFYPDSKKQESGYDFGVKRLLLAIAQPPTQRRLRQQQIYMSHSYANFSFAERVVLDLRAEGFTMFMSVLDTQGGDNWFGVMSSAIRASTELIICVSPDILDSVWITREVLIAEEILNIEIIPIVVQDLLDSSDTSIFRAFIMKLAREHPELMIPRYLLEAISAVDEREIFDDMYHWLRDNSEATRLAALPDLLDYCDRPLLDDFIRWLNTKVPSLIPQVFMDLVHNNDPIRVEACLRELFTDHPQYKILNTKKWLFASQIPDLIATLNAIYEGHPRSKVFISYRRADSQVMTERLYDNLKMVIREQDIFLDTEKIPIGQDFQKFIDRTLAETAVILVMIGSEWASIKNPNEQQPRLDNLDDAVRIEVATALADDDIEVMPVLVDGTKMPRADDLPEPLKPLSTLNAIDLRSGKDFGSDTTRIIEEIYKITGAS